MYLLRISHTAGKEVFIAKANIKYLLNDMSLQVGRMWR